MNDCSFIRSACILMVAVPGKIIAVGIWIYGLCKYGGRENDDWLDEYP